MTENITNAKELGIGDDTAQPGLYVVFANGDVVYFEFDNPLNWWDMRPYCLVLAFTNGQRSYIPWHNIGKVHLAPKPYTTESGVENDD